MASSPDNSEDELRPQKISEFKDNKSVKHHFMEEGATSKIGLAFSRILEKRSKGDVLAESKSVQKRIREAEEEAQHRKLAKQHRLEKSKRGHTAVLPVGRDPGQDAHEKMLMSVATKGVVQLFNAISKAQQTRSTSEAAGDKSKDISKASKEAFLEVLKPGKAKGEQELEEPSQGWKVLQKGFTGFAEVSKMKDFDKVEENSEEDEDQVEDLEEDSDENFDEW